MRAAFALAQLKDASAVKADAQNLLQLIKLAKESVQTNERMVL